MKSPDGDRTPALPRRQRKWGRGILLPLSIGLSCALSTALLLLVHFHPDGSLFEVPEALLMRRIFSNEMASSLILQFKGKPFGNVVVHAEQSGGEVPSWTLRLSASGSLPEEFKNSIQWTLRANGLFSASTHEFKQAEIFLVEKSIPLEFAAQLGSRPDHIYVRIGTESNPRLELSGGLDHIRAELVKRFGWSLLAGMSQKGATSLRILRKRVELSGKPLDLFLVRERNNSVLGDFIFAVSLTGQPLYLRLLGGFEAIYAGFSEKDLEAFRQLR